MTALDDAMGAAIDALLGVAGAGQRNVGFRLVVLTDGYENSSIHYKKRLAGMIRRVQRTKRWKIAVFTPKGGVLRLQELGVQLESETDINAAFARFKELADRKSDIFDEDILALVSDESVTHEQETYRLVSLRQHSETRLDIAERQTRLALGGRHQRHALEPGDIGELRARLAVGGGDDTARLRHLADAVDE